MTNIRDERTLRLIINPSISNDPCAFCGTRTDPCGVDVVAGQALVCGDCSDHHAPGLARVGRALAFLSDQQIEHMLILARILANLNGDDPDEEVARVRAEHAPLTP